MKLIFCLDDKNGMMFFGRRQSQDSALRQWMINRIADHKFWMSLYSSKQFEVTENIVVDDDYSSKAGPNDFCFIENGNFNINDADEVIICRWNRKYQADRVFDVDLKKEGFNKITSENIKGSSHDKITIDTYKRG